MDADQTVPTLPPAPTAPPTAAPTSPTWAPPGVGGVPAAAPPAAALAFDPVAEEPRRSRRPLYALVAVVALLVVGVGALVALRSGSGGDGDALVEVEESSAFSLAAAAEQATEASTVRYEMNMSMGALGDMTMVGGMDSEAQIMTMTMDMGAILGGQGLGQIEAIIDAGNGVMYISNPGGMGFPTDAAWISMNLAELAEQSGMSVDDFQDQFTANPLDVAEMFTDADTVVDVGAETIDGVAVRHYLVTVDLEAALAANPQLEQQVDLSDLGADIPTEIVYDVWVTEDNQLRRMTFALDIVGQEMVVEMNVTAVGEPLDVQIPSPDEVMDLTDLLGGL